MPEHGVAVPRDVRVGLEVRGTDRECGGERRERVLGSIERESAVRENARGSGCEVLIHAGRVAAPAGWPPR